MVSYRMHIYYIGSIWSHIVCIYTISDLYGHISYLYILYRIYMVPYRMHIYYIGSILDYIYLVQSHSIMWINASLMSHVSCLMSHVISDDLCINPYQTHIDPISYAYILYRVHRPVDHIFL